MRSVYEAGSSIEDVLSYSGPYNGQPYPGLDPLKDRVLLESIAGHFERGVEADAFSA